MAAKSNPVTLGTANTTIYECPATFAAYAQLFVANVTGSPVNYQLKFLKQSTGITTNVAPQITLAANAPMSAVCAFSMEAGDKIIGIATAANAVVATPVISLGDSSAALGLTPRGEWLAGTTYAANDVVSVTTNGDSWISIQNGNIGNTPGAAPAHWMLLSARGTPGAAGGGDMLATNNLAECTDDVLACTNIGALSKTGGTMTGALTLSGDPSIALHAVTKQYVDAGSGRVTPEQFGAIGDGVADDTAAFVALAAYINGSAKNGATVLFGAGKNYKIWPTVSGYAVLMQFTGGIRNLTIDCNGSRIFSPAPTFDGARNLILFQSGSGPNEDIRIEGLWFEQTAFVNSATAAGGTHVLAIHDSFKGLVCNNLKINSALSGVSIVRLAGSGAGRARGISIVNPYCERVFYPINLQKNGDDVEIVGGYFRDTGRSLFVYNVHNVKAQYVEDYTANIAPSIVLVANSSSLETDWENSTTNIDLTVRLTGAVANQSSPHCGIICQTENTHEAPAIIRNVKLHIDAELRGGASNTDVIEISKSWSGGGVDTVLRGHVIDNVVISGNINFNASYHRAFGIAGAAAWYRSGTASTITTQSVAFTASTDAGDTLTVTAVSSGTIYKGTTFNGTSISGGTRILRQLTGTPGGVGTYQIGNKWSALASQACTGGHGLLTFGGTMAGATDAAIGCVVSGTGVVPWTRITDKAGANWIVDNNTAVAATTITAAETIRNIVLRDFVAVGALQGQGAKSISANLTGLTGPLVLDNVTVDLPCNITGATSTNLKVKSYRYLGTETDTIVEAGGEARREVLTAARTYYVRADGNDSNTGLANTAGGAFLTIQKAINTVIGIDLAAYDATIQVADGTYTAGAILKSYVGAGPVRITGNVTTPANCIINAAGDCFPGDAVLGKYVIRGFQLDSSGSSCISAAGGSVIDFGEIEFMSVPVYHVLATSNSHVRVIGHYTVKGGAYAHYNAETGAIISTYGANTATHTGTFAFNFYALGSLAGTIYVSGNTYNVAGATVTGTRYLANSNTIIHTGGGGANYFPGNAAGSVGAGGQYI